MNITITKCDNCDAENRNTNDLTWTRHLGSYQGQPLVTMQPQGLTAMPGQPAIANAVRPLLIDLCADCSNKVTLSQLIAISATKGPKAGK